MQLTNPIWLWGLTGLLIPIGIHLLSRKEGKIIRFGSLRHLEESHTKQSINVRLNEVALLIIRCALIVLIVMLLCGLNINLFQTQNSRWIILEEGLERDPTILPLIDSLKQKGFEAKSMTKCFPDASAVQAEPFENYWKMIDQLPLESLSNVIIVSYSLSSKFRGKRIALPENVTWIFKESEPKEFTISRVKFSNDSVLVRRGKSSSLQTSFTTLTEHAGFGSRSGESENKVPLLAPDTLHIKIHADRDFEYDRKIITASLRAIEKTIPAIFKLSTTETAEDLKAAPPDWIIWLTKNLPDQAETNTNSIVMSEDESGNSPLLMNVTKSGAKQKWLITKRLNVETALNEQLTLNLSSLLTKNELAEARADSLDQTAVPEESLWSRDVVNASTASVPVEDDKTGLFLFILIVTILITERLVAFKRNA